MSRTLRTHCEDGIYHVMARGNQRYRLFDTEKDYRVFLRLLKIIQRRTGITLYAYCLMPNHLHFLLKVGQTPLSKFMQPLLCRYASYRNWSLEGAGHVFQGRFKAKACEEDDYFMWLLRYIDRNPVKAGLVRDPAAWRWSGHTEVTGLRPGAFVDADYVLRLFSDDPARAVDRYKDFVGSSLSCLTPERTLEGEEDPRSIALAHAFEKISENISEKTASGAALPLQRVLDGDKGRPAVSARRYLIEGLAGAGAKPFEIARILGCSPEYAGRCLREREVRSGA